MRALPIKVKVDQTKSQTDLQVYLSPQLMQQNLLTDGLILKVSSLREKSIYARVQGDPTLLKTESIRISRLLRKNLFCYLGEIVQVSPEPIQERAEFIEVHQIQNDYTVKGNFQKYSRQFFSNFDLFPIIENFYFPIHLLNSVFEFKITKTQPEGPCLINQKTKIVFSDSLIEDHNSPSFAQLSYSNIAGLDNVINLIRNSIEYPLSIPIRSYPSNSFLLTIPTGCGKTLLAQAIHNESPLFFYYIACMDFLNENFETAGNSLFSIFQQAEKSVPSILYLDDYDSFLHFPSSFLNYIQTSLQYLLTQKNIFIIATTRQPLPEMTLFATKITVDLPNPQSLQNFINILEENTLFFKQDYDFDYFAHYFPKNPSKSFLFDQSSDESSSLTSYLSPPLTNSKTQLLNHNSSDQNFTSFYNPFQNFNDNQKEMSIITYSDIVRNFKSNTISLFYDALLGFDIISEPIPTISNRLTIFSDLKHSSFRITQKSLITSHEIPSIGSISEKISQLNSISSNSQNQMNSIENERLIDLPILSSSINDDISLKENPFDISYPFSSTDGIFQNLVVDLPQKSYKNHQESKSEKKPSYHEGEKIQDPFKTESQFSSNDEDPFACYAEISQTNVDMFGAPIQTSSFKSKLVNFRNSDKFFSLNLIEDNQEEQKSNIQSGSINSINSIGSSNSMNSLNSNPKTNKLKIQKKPNKNFDKSDRHKRKNEKYNSSIYNDPFSIPPPSVEITNQCFKTYNHSPISRIPNNYKSLSEFHHSKNSFHTYTFVKNNNDESGISENETKFDLKSSKEISNTNNSNTNNNNTNNSNSNNNNTNNSNNNSTTNNNNNTNNSKNTTTTNNNTNFNNHSNIDRIELFENDDNKLLEVPPYNVVKDVLNHMQISSKKVPPKILFIKVEKVKKINKNSNMANLQAKNDIEREILDPKLYEMPNKDSSKKNSRWKKQKK